MSWIKGRISNQRLVVAVGLLALLAPSRAEAVVPSSAVAGVEFDNQLNALVRRGALGVPAPLFGNGKSIGVPGDPNQILSAQGSVLIGAGGNNFDVNYAGAQTNTFFRQNVNISIGPGGGSNVYATGTKTDAFGDTAGTTLYTAGTFFGGGGSTLRKPSFALNSTPGFGATMNVTATDALWSNPANVPITLNSGDFLGFKFFLPQGAQTSVSVSTPSLTFGGGSLNIPNIVFSTDGINGNVGNAGGPAVVGGPGTDYIWVGPGAPGPASSFAVIPEAGNAGNTFGTSSVGLNSPGIRASLKETPATVGGVNGWNVSVWAVAFGNTITFPANSTAVRAGQIWTIMSDPGVDVEWDLGDIPLDVILPDYSQADVPEPGCLALIAVAIGSLAMGSRRMR